MLLLLSILATTFSFAGIYFNAHKHRFCWSIWIAADTLWILYGILTGQWILCILHTGYLFSNMYGLKKWKRPIAEEGQYEN